MPVPVIAAGGLGNGTWGGQAWGLSDGGTYILSAANNEFIVTGCILFVELLVTGDDRVINSCGTVCGTAPTPTPDPVQTSRRCCKKCSGIGWCQTPIPTAGASYDVRLRFVYHGLIPTSLFLFLPDLSFSVLIAEEGWFDGNSAFNLTAVPAAGRSTHNRVPAVLAWAIRSSVLQGPNKTLDENATCPRDIGSTAACHSRYSSCTSIHTSDNIYTRGYTCKCWDGYRGNPYLPDGCQGKHYLLLSQITLDEIDGSN
ncbi:hypothetical protein BAE44_0017038 [Dichanthelium oligosanthes]|uniref:Wall-associated receptor kinase galacturonan-binding domain-containing protein n=1 Tax=Dichanthelium oligosanthes TaxID=888268 RepID=A0A1E5V9W6_9POAL|nr:hypothetical protein BAE44_0017038 [Dichanthelium oligosanthes]